MTQIIEVGLNTFSNTLKMQERRSFSKATNLAGQKRKIDNSIEVKQKFSFSLSFSFDEKRDWKYTAKVANKLGWRKWDGNGQRYEQIKLFVVFSLNIMNIECCLKRRRKRRKKKNYWIAKRLTAHYWKPWPNCHWQNCLVVYLHSSISAATFALRWIP